MPDQKISQDQIVTILDSTSSFPVIQGGVNKQIFRDPLATAVAQALGMSQVSFYVLEFDGTPQAVDFGTFWDPATTDLGIFFYEAWVKFLPGWSSSIYLISDGYGGAHAILFSGTTGNVYDGTSSTSFASDDAPYIGQWSHVAVGWSDGVIVTYYDGVPTGKVAFAGPRKTPGPAGGAGIFFLGGSDHQNFIGRIAQVRSFEGDNPNKSVAGNGQNLCAFVPQTVFGGSTSTYSASLLAQFYRPEQIISDLSKGSPVGTNHPGRIRGTGFAVTSNRSTYPAPQYVLDPDAPNALQLVAPVQPAGKIYTPASVPGGALVFDSFERKNVTYAFEGLGGLGSTEGGSLGPLPWSSTSVPNFSTIKSFGILNEKAVLLDNTGYRFARVAVGQTNLDIRVDRTNGSNGSGISTGILFRYVDDDNYCLAVTTGSTGTNQLMNIGQVVAGAWTQWAGSQAMPSTWTTFRVVTKSDGTATVYADATQVYTTTNAQHASATGGAGLHAQLLGLGLACRWNNFTVFVAP